MFCDQDDIWESNKIETIKKSINKKSSFLKMYNGKCIDNKGNIVNNDLFKYIGVEYGLLSNIRKNSFIGCNIIFSKELLKVISDELKTINGIEYLKSNNIPLTGILKEEGTWGYVEMPYKR